MKQKRGELIRSRYLGSYVDLLILWLGKYIDTGGKFIVLEVACFKCLTTERT